jgi:hypothetical protein
MHGRDPGDKISGEHIIVKCRKPGRWEMYRMSGQHKGWGTSAKKNAQAEIEQGYTYVQEQRQRKS